MITDFSFDGTTLSEMGYMLCDFSGNTEETAEVSVLDYTEIKAPLSDKSHKVATSYPNNYTKTLQICKREDCLDRDKSLVLTDDDVMKMTRWLCRKEYKWFNWDKEEYYKIIQGEPVLQEDRVVYYQVHCKVSKIVFGGECHGLEITLETNAPYGFSKEYENVPTAIASGDTIDIGPNNAEGQPCLINEEGYIYPYFEFTFSSSGDWTFTNTTTWSESGRFPDYNRFTSIKNVQTGEKIIFSGGDVLQIQAFDSQGTATHSSLYKDFNYVFPRICCTYSKSRNTFTVNGAAVVVKYRYRSIRKVGL